jgi:glycerate kinase
VPGFDLVADRIDLEERIEGADLVITGEGFVDEQSFLGKVVGGVLDLATDAHVAAAVVAGEILQPVPPPARAISLVERFGRDRAMTDTLACIEEATRSLLVG